MGALLLALGVVFVAELGDKTQLVVLTMGARQRLVAVIPAIALTIALLQAIAVTVGATLARVVPDLALELGAAALFAVFAVLTWRGAGREEAEVGEAGARRGVLGMCVAFFLAELGDKTQLTTAALAFGKVSSSRAWCRARNPCTVTSRSVTGPTRVGTTTTAAAAASS